ncbi:DEAD/DEAH box helicase [Halobacteriales archaeon QH_6_64_20]|nr:MAG: DEAD/DEAH box helicase [Halobacteriales archaeon QH_6_64_20]
MAGAVAEEFSDSEFADVFPFERFNRMQREALPALVERDENVVVSAPTASGKTVLAELAICRALDAGETALFIAPLRALTNEKEAEWERFESLGYSVYVVTGERDLNPRRAERADILVMTPEKADSATRKHDSPRYSFITDVDCCVIDEVHLLDADRRGSVLEIAIARLRRLCDPRVVALSATMGNVRDVAEWLDAPPECTFDFGDEFRPVDLHADVKTYTHGENAFADKYRRLYRALDLAETHLREAGQALVFVSSRQDTVRAAEKARDELAARDVPMSARGDGDFQERTERVENAALRRSVTDGVAFHHAGLSKNDKDLIERWFREGFVELLFSTSTLAWGVNLPARCVVIRDTKLHDPLEGEVDMSPLDVLQMLGRAGRPGYDDVGYAWVVCDGSEVGKYRKLLREGKPIESRLAEDLDAHLNAEIAMGTIRDLEDVMDWLETTFYYVRAGSEPEQYASAYYLRLDTARRFHEVARKDEIDADAILRAVAGAEEFDSVNARQAERDAINAVLGGANVAADLGAGGRKVLAVLRASAMGSTPKELRSDAWIVRQNALRLLGALRAFLARFAEPEAANRARRTEARVEHGVSADAIGLTAISGVGPGRASKLASEAITTPAEVRGAGVEGLVAAGLGEGVAEAVLENARELPAIDVDWGTFPDRIGTGESEMCEVRVRNAGGDANGGVRVTVNDVEMSSTTTYLGETTLPVGVFGGNFDELRFTVRVTFPDLPIHPVVETRIVTVE